EQPVEPDRLLADRLPADHHRGHGEQRRQAEEPHRETVQAEAEPNVERTVDEPCSLADGEGAPRGGLRAGEEAQDQPRGAGERDDGGHRGALSHGRHAARAEQPGGERT
ncbi:MAG: hypothetical protein ACK55I_34195, partial [bacterium]